MKIQHFTDLKVWQMGHTLSLDIYRLTESFPKSEVFGLTSQMRRCSVSITSNIAEGFGRQTRKDKIRFYNISRGSILELESQLLLVKDLGWSEESHCKTIMSQLTETHKTLNGLIRSLQ